MLRTGRVSSVNAKNHTCKVEFFESDGWISDEVRVLARRRGDYALPQADDLVLVAFDENLFAGVGFLLGIMYSEADAAPLDDAGKRSLVSDDLRLGASDATDKVALAPATKSEMQKVLDYANGIALAIQAGVPTPQDGGAGLKATIVAGLPIKPTLNEPASEKVSAK
jgi:phage baseplate assembly protein gpV